MQKFDQQLDELKVRIYKKINRQCELWRFYFISKRPHFKGKQCCVFIFLSGDRIEQKQIKLPMTINDIFS